MIVFIQMKKIFFTILIHCSLLFFLKAQIVPPDFLCVSGDSLFWELPVNNCGPFVSYDVFFSNNLDGPYSLLAAVTDVNQGFLEHPNPAGQVFYYYLVSNFDCPGQSQVSSDTLDNRLPERSSLRRITVQGSNVLLDWDPSPSPEVFAYIVYRRDPIGVVPIDTVFGGITTYIDTNAEPDLEPEGYFVNALDRCGNTSVFDVEHVTMFLEAEATNCSIDLSWNVYQGWVGGAGSQEIWVSKNGGTPVSFETIDGNIDFYPFRDVDDGATFCFFIQANENAAGESSRSSETCVTATFSQPVNELYITNVSVQPDNSISIDWGVNANADVEILEYLRGDTGGGFEIINTAMPTSPFPVANQFSDVSADVSNGPAIYQLHAIDSCDNELVTAPAATIFLSGDATSISTNQLFWTPLVIENAMVSEYKIFRVVNSAETQIGTVASNQLDFEDMFDPGSISSASICYYIEADGVVTTPDGTDLNITSRSNISCIDQAIRIFVPNALAPSGVNREFKPVLLAGSIATYEMQIFNRYGGAVFSTDDPDEAWKGKKDGRKLPQGVYVYRIRLVLENGNVTERKGNVVLLQ